MQLKWNEEIEPFNILPAQRTLLQYTPPVGLEAVFVESWVAEEL